MVVLGYPGPRCSANAFFFKSFFKIFFVLYHLMLGIFKARKYGMGFLAAKVLVQGFFGYYWNS